MGWKFNYKKNKWTICLENYYFLEDEKITRTHVVAIPPTNGDRIDVIGTSGKYYLGMTKKRWNERVKFENGEWSPRVIQDNIELVVDIKGGIPTIKNKL